MVVDGALSSTTIPTDRMCKMAELPQYPYECQCKGHAGSSRTFTAAPPEWFAGKGISTPRNCPDCRTWIKAQADETKSCDCGIRFRISARAKISQHKKVGPYVDPTQCRQCESGKKPNKGLKRKIRNPKKKEKKPDEFEKLKIGINPSPRIIVTDPEVYGSMTTRNAKSGTSETRLEHLERHLPDSPNSWVGRSGSKTSPTSLAPNAKNGGELLSKLKPYMEQVDSSSVREYMMDNNRIVRITFTGDHDGLEKTVLRANSDGTYTVITSHDEVTVSEVKGNNWYTSGRSQR